MKTRITSRTGSRTMLKNRSKKRIVLLTCLFVLVLLYLFRGAWLPFFGTFLVVNQELEKSDVIVVLGTHTKGERVDWAVQLYKQGLAKKIIMCGYPAGWRTSTAEIMKKQALFLGVPEGAIILDEGWNTNGTWGNATNSLKIIQENQFKTAIVVSSSYHTLRSKLAFRRIFKNVAVRLLFSGCPDSSFNPDKWWTSLRSARILITEYVKLIYYFLVPPNLAIKLEF